LEKGIIFGKGDNHVYLLPEMSNRHGLIAGATGTGKTISLKVMAEAFSDMGVPVFLADVKGDLSGLAKEGSENKKILERIDYIGLDSFIYTKYPVEFWDVFGKKGLPVRTTVTEMGPLLLSRLLELNETQSSILTIAFKIADDMGMLILDLKDLRSMLMHIGDNASELRSEYGNISPQSIGAIQRKIIVLEEQGGNKFFGEPDLDIMDFMKLDREGKGVINILSSEELYNYPQLYSTFLLWFLSELFEELPEVGDVKKPKLVFFFDEAHLLFYNTPKALMEKIEQVVRLIRSKGVGIFFVTQNPSDIPDNVLGQLGNRVQHALRAFTPKDQKAIKASAQTFRTNPLFKTEEAITQLSVGEALVSFLDIKGAPCIVEKAIVCPPKSFIGMIEEDKKSELINFSYFKDKYSNEVDRESAYELLKVKAERQEKINQNQRKQEETNKRSKTKSSGYQRQTTFEKTTKSLMTAIGRQLGTSLARGILGSLKK
jgi:DNA helicase HerA-like ATPase